MPQDREGARTDPKQLPCPPRTPKPPRVYPPLGLVIDYTQEALFELVYRLLHHGVVVQGNVGQGVGNFEVIPTHTKDPHTMSPNRTRGTDRMGDTEGSKRRVILHPCTVCVGICYGPTSKIRDDELLRFVSKTHYFHIIFCFILQFSIVSQFISI